MNAPSSDELVAVVDRIVFENQDSGFFVIKVKERGKKELTTIVGNLLGVDVGQTVICQGAWRHKPQYGWSFEVANFHSKPPEDKDTIFKYLQSGSIRGIGAVYAQKIVDAFGAQTLHILEQTPEKLQSVPGIGPKRLDSILQSWSQQQHLRELLLFLQPYDVSTALAQKIYKSYGQQAIARIQSNPFDLSQDVYGIGFKRADQIASKMGLTKNHPTRLRAAIHHILEEATSEGHTCLPSPLLIERAALLCEEPVSSIEDALQLMQDDQTLHSQEITYEGQRLEMVWSKTYFGSERSIASQLRRLLEHPCKLRKFQIGDAIHWAQKKRNLQLSPDQEEAVKQACKNKVMILTGGPGTGKSTITQIVITIFRVLTDKILLAAPTGRAAKRLSEINGLCAQTLHQLLEFDPRTGHFKRTPENPLTCDLVIVDEASMLDTFLLYHLLKALGDSCRLLLVGDTDQLPSVGAGNVLRDMIQSTRIPIKRLTQIYRQASTSKIILGAHEINRGQAPIHQPHEGDDFFFLRVENPEKILATICSLVSERLPKKYNLNPLHDIQVLSPMKKGLLGIESLNDRLQSLLQVGSTPVTIGYRRFFIGDKLMQLRNNYQKEIFNGDLLYLKEIDEQARLLWATASDDRVLEYTFSELDELAHAYAVSVHKYQGSECPCIVMPVHSSHTILLQRNLLYTAVTRGKKLVILIGSPDAMTQGCLRQEADLRYTGLFSAIVECFGAYGQLFQQPSNSTEPSN